MSINLYVKVLYLPRIGLEFDAISENKITHIRIRRQSTFII